jgi:hypothetical protein
MYTQIKGPHGPNSLSNVIHWSVMDLGWMVFKGRIVQDYKEPKIEIYKLIWDLVFKCNGSGR